jgi:hypothetical protein
MAKGDECKVDVQRMADTINVVTKEKYEEGVEDESEICTAVRMSLNQWFSQIFFLWPQLRPP